jgi:hypothetical protein
MVPSLRLKQAGIEIPQFRVFDVAGQEVKPFAGPGFDQARDQEPIDGPMGLVLSDKIIQLATVATGYEAAESDVPLLEQIEHLLEMFQLLIYDHGQLATELGLVDVGQNQVHRTSGRLLFAMGVIHQDFGEVFIDLP